MKESLEHYWGQVCYCCCLTQSAAIIPEGSCESRQSYLVIEELHQGEARAGREAPPGIFRVQKGSSMMALG